MILSDRSIREELAAGRIVIDPLDDSCIQPSSVDLHVDRYFRVFRNHTMGYIDVKQDQEDLTELVTIESDDVLILHPGEFVLGSTYERVRLPDDLVARLEGKSSLGRLGLLIHSSLPASEGVLFLDEGGASLSPRPIGEIVQKQRRGWVVSFDPDTFLVDYHEVTGWYEGPPDRIFEVVLASSRSVRVTAGHNLFTLDRHGDVRRIRTAELAPGVLVALPGRIPDPPAPSSRLVLLELAPESAHGDLTVSGPVVRRAFRERPGELRRALRGRGFRHVDYYSDRERLPVSVAREVTGILDRLGPDDLLSVPGSRHGLPAVIHVTEDLAWLLGLYVAEGCRRRNQVTVSNTDPLILDRAQEVMTALGLPVYRGAGSVTAMSGVFSFLVEWLGIGANAHEKRVPRPVFGWPRPLLDAFFEGFVDGDGSREPTRTSLWSSSGKLVDDFLYLTARRGERSGASFRGRRGHGMYQISIPYREHKLLTSVPLPDRLLVELRHEAGLSQAAASEALGYTNPSDLNNLERRSGRDAVRLSTIRRLRRLYRSPRLDRLADGDLRWDRVVEVRDTGTVEPVYDLEVRPGGRHVENFLAGTGGVFVSNTAGFVDAGWDGHLTLELSNVANLPITLYPGMKIGQISFLRMTTAAEHPYGSTSVGSKYQGQRGPTPSRYFENFRPRP